MTEETYQNELADLQRELVLLQQSVEARGERLLVIVEGRDAAGKGGAIRRFTRHLNPRAARVVALPKPTDAERGQWYFQRYLKELPNKGEIRFFDRSWYNRAVVEPVLGFCTPEQYETFMQQVPTVERMLIEDGIKIIKFWFSINRTVQKKRFDARSSDILKRWKLSTVDAIAQEKWDEFTKYKEAMFKRTNSPTSPWIIVNGNVKATARVESIRYVLSQCDYEGKGSKNVQLTPDPRYIAPFSEDLLADQHFSHLTDEQLAAANARRKKRKAEALLKCPPAPASEKPPRETVARKRPRAARASAARPPRNRPAPKSRPAPQD